MAVELHLPDLPDVHVTLGAVRGGALRPSLPWHLRLREALAAYLPLLLMALLALATWWLVKNTPLGTPAAEAPALRSEPDYTMTEFALQRFDPDGRMTLRIDGRELRHFPDTDRTEIIEPSIRAIAPDGRVTTGRARRALANGDASEVQMFGDATVQSRDGKGLPLELRSEFLHFFLVTERVRTTMPVQVLHGRDRLSAAGLELDLPTRRLDLQGPMRGVLPPPPP